MKNNVITSNIYADIKTILDKARHKTFKAVNFFMVDAYRNIGKRIVEEEQNGKKRAEYGTYLLRDLAKFLIAEFGQGFSEQSLRNMRQFYMLFPIRSTLWSELTWSHYKLLIRVENKNAREFYGKEAVSSNWSVRVLERQINSLYYERLLSSKKKNVVENEMRTNVKLLSHNPYDYLKDPYVLEFLNIKGESHYLEKDIEQMDMYVRMYEDKIRSKDDNPTIGLILCTEKDGIVAKYSVLQESEQLFAAKYQLYLPTEQELIDELEREKAILKETQSN